MAKPHSLGGSRQQPVAQGGLAAWIERNVALPQGLAAEPGRVKLWPWQREIADAITDPAYERVTLLKPTRVGLALCGCCYRSLLPTRCRLVDEGCDDSAARYRCPGDGDLATGQTRCYIIPTVAASTPASNSRS